MRKSLYLSNRVYQIDLDSHRQAMGFSFGIVGGSFAAIVAYACISEPSDYIRYSADCFAAALPLALFHALLSVFVAQGGWSTRTSRILSFVSGLSCYLSAFAGIGLMLFHISDIAAWIFLLLSAFATVFSIFYARRHGTTCELLDARNHEESQTIQPPLTKG